jgi:MFS family permease
LSPGIDVKHELNLIKGLFFLFGLLIMSWVPRFPEVKAHLQLTNGEFGSIVSMGAIGNIVALLSVGHLVHKYGALWMLHISSLLLSVSLIFLTHSTSSLVFLIFICGESNVFFPLYLPYLLPALPLDGLAYSQMNTSN